LSHSSDYASLLSEVKIGNSAFVCRRPEERAQGNIMMSSLSKALKLRQHLASERRRLNPRERRKRSVVRNRRALKSSAPPFQTTACSMKLFAPTEFKPEWILLSTS
jgi:hypothetical protein